MYGSHMASARASRSRLRLCVFSSRNFVVASRKVRCLATRRAVVQGWKEVGKRLAGQGQLELAEAVRTFVVQLPQPRTDKELIKEPLLEKRRARYPQDPYR
jgi:hypothetical protein